MATTTDTAKGGSRLQQKAGGTAGAGKNNAGGKNNSDGDEAAPKSSKRLVLILLIAVLVLAGAGAGAYMMFFKTPSEPPPPAAGEIVQMEPTTLSLADRHYLKVQVAIELVEGKATADTFDTVQAQALVVDTFSNLDADAISNNKARNKLAEKLLDSIQQAYPEEVFDLYITQFVIQ